VREIAELYRGANGESRIELVLEQTLPGLPLDVPRMRQLVHNLLKNALEAQQGAADREVRILTRDARRVGRPMVELVIADNGPGFPPELLNRLFEPYVTSKPRGTGLGLAIVRKIVEEHDGRVKAENQSERGAMVTVSLPYPTALPSAVELGGDAA